MKMIALGYSLLLMVSLGVNAQTASEYDDLYSACLDQAGSINNGVVMECSGEVAEQAEIEMTQRYIVGKTNIDTRTLRVFGIYDDDYNSVGDEC